MAQAEWDCWNIPPPFQLEVTILIPSASLPITSSAAMGATMPWIAVSPPTGKVHSEVEKHQDHLREISGPDFLIFQLYIGVKKDSRVKF